ncbi:MAG: hypothetical protein R3E97_24375 [Candidatus Eisenbacteria bacterium]
MASDHDRPSIGVGVLLALVALSFLGRFLPGPSTWGFHLHAYLPLTFTAVWFVLSVVAFLPPFQNRSGQLLGAVGKFGVSSALGPLVLAAVFAGLFTMLSERSYFMGDGYLVGELIQQGMPFRAFDNMDYVAHFQVYKSLRSPIDPGKVSSFEIYRWGAVLAGVLGTLILSFLSALLRWNDWQKALVVLLFLFSGPAAMFYGYVESYGYLLVFTSAFLLSGVLVFQRRLPLWVASTFFGLAVFSHLTAAFAAPALLFLALFAPGTSRIRSLVLGLGPALLVFVASIVAHIALGYDQEFFRREFLEAQNTKNLWVSLTGEHGFFSAQHWIDLLNLGLLSLPVPLAIVALRFQRIVRGIRLRLVQFLLLHAASVSIFLLFLDRKLGGARDWDLLAAHGFGIVLLAVWALADGAETDGSAVRERVPALAKAAFPAAFLLSVPWFLLLHLEGPSIARFTDVAAGFPRFPRAYAYEELGKYYRNHNDVDRALEMYERCVETFPGNGRFQVLLGSMYMTKASGTQEETERRELLPGRPRPPIGREPAFRSPSRPPSPGSTWRGVSRSRTGGRKRPTPTAGPRSPHRPIPRSGRTSEPRCSASGDWRTRSVPTGTPSPSTPATRCGDRSGPRTWDSNGSTRRSRSSGMGCASARIPRYSGMESRPAWSARPSALSRMAKCLRWKGLQRPNRYCGCARRRSERSGGAGPLPAPPVAVVEPARGFGAVTPGEKPPRHSNLLIR